MHPAWGYLPGTVSVHYPLLITCTSPSCIISWTNSAANGDQPHTKQSGSGINWTARVAMEANTGRPHGYSADCNNSVADGCPCLRISLTLASQFFFSSSLVDPSRALNCQKESNRRVSESQMGRQPRQRPISCTLCRVRKLRCSRVFPCSNCTSRGVVCQHEGVVHDATLANQPKSAALPKDISASELLSRLQRLESLVATQAKTQTQPQIQPPAITSTISAEPRKAPYPEPGPPTALNAVPSRLQRLTADALWLERSCSGQKLLVSSCPPSGQPTFTTFPPASRARLL
jgi:hypothetical protein